jgi:hypothetical protein
MHSGKLFFGIVLFSLLCVTGLPSPVDAQVTNGTFDGWTAVNHPGWDHIGLVAGRYPDIYQEAPNTTEPPATMQTPDSFTFQPEGGASPAEIATLFGAPATEAGIIALDTSPAVPSYGAAIAQTFNVGAGQLLTFQWNYVSFDDLGEDFAFVFLTGPSGTILARLAGQSDLLTPPNNLDLIPGETGLKTFTSDPLAAGSYRLGLAVMNSRGNENAGGSALIVDNVTLVPEPASLAILALAAGCVSRRARRR